MQGHGAATAAAVSDRSLKPKKPISREVSSRFLSPSSSSSSSSSSSEHGNRCPNNNLSLPRQKPRSSTDSRKHKSFQNSGFLRGLWPSSSAPSPFSNSKPDTLADCLGHDRLKDMEERKSKDKRDHHPLFGRQRSCTEFSRFENDQKNKTHAKENLKPVFGGSMGYTGKFRFPGKSSSRPSDLPDDDRNDGIVPGRLSVDEIALRKKSFGARGLSDSDTQDSESEYSDMCSGGTSFDTPAAGKVFPASYMAPTVSSRKHGIEVPSKFLRDLSSRSRRWSADSGLDQKPVSSDNNSNSSSKKFTLKKANGNWASSPGGAGSPKSDNKGKMMGLTSSKPPTSPSRGKGVGSILSLGIELLKGKKSSSGASSAEHAHQLRLLHGRLMQWRYGNARAEAVNGSAIKQAESNFLHAWTGLVKLQYSALQKRLQLQKEKSEMKLNCILHSQMKALEMWGNMERQHLSAVTTTKDCLHSVVCRVPLVDGAQVEPQSVSIAVRYASELAASINLMLTTFTPMIEKTAREVAELAMVVTQEKLLLEECLDLYRQISTLEVQETSLKSGMMQLNLPQQQLQYIVA